MFPLLFSVLSGVRELSATASLAEILQPEMTSELPSMPGVSPRDLVASLCPIAVALIVATIRYRNEKQVQQRTFNPQTHSALLLTFGDAGIMPYSNCDDLGAVLERQRSETFYISDSSVVIFKVRSRNLSSMEWRQTCRLNVSKRQVDGILYRVHRHYFCSEPSALADMFATRAPQLVEVNGKEQLEGTTDESAIEIAGVTPIEFEALLRFFYSS